MRVGSLNWSEEMISKTRPDARFAAADGLHVSIWKTKAAGNEDEFLVKLFRFIPMENGEFQTTSCIRESDLLNGCELLQKAKDWIQSELSRRSSQDRS